MAEPMGELCKPGLYTVSPFNLVVKADGTAVLRCRCYALHGYVDVPVPAPVIRDESDAWITEEELGEDGDPCLK